MHCAAQLRRHCHQPQQASFLTGPPPRVEINPLKSACDCVSGWGIKQSHRQSSQHVECICQCTTAYIYLYITLCVCVCVVSCVCVCVVSCVCVCVVSCACVCVWCHVRVCVCGYKKKRKGRYIFLAAVKTHHVAKSKQLKHQQSSLPLFYPNNWNPNSHP